MAAEKHYLALDMGAESGRGLVGVLADDKIRLEEVHRFPNGPVQVIDSLHWDVLRQFQEMKNAIGAAKTRFGEIESLGVDTWGVDFGLIGKNDVLLGNPYHYRDARTDGMIEAACEKMPREKIFEHTGIQFMQLNSIFQLFSMVQADSPLLVGAERLLFMADLFHFLLSGSKVAEFSLATTSQLYDVRQGQWAKPVFDALGLPFDIMPEVVPTGTRLGELLDHIATDTGAGKIPVVAPACHDTGCAVAAVPVEYEDWAYLSSGTWSLIGLELVRPIVNDQVLEHGFTNEGGVNNTTRFLRNIMGLWLVQECRRQWANEGTEYSYDALTRLASQADPFTAFVNPDDETFLGFGQMPTRIQEYCRKTGQTVPESHGAIVRCALESLALRYRLALEGMEEIEGRRVQALHIVGGGSQNRLLNQLTANALGVPVIAGPVEATAAGNIIVQAISDGELASLEEGRELVRASFEVETFEPQEGDAWAGALERFRKLV